MFRYCYSRFWSIRLKIRRRLQAVKINRTSVEACFMVFLELLFFRYLYCLYCLLTFVGTVYKTALTIGICQRDRDYKQNGSKKQMRLTHGEFMRRFAMHILPKRFVKIRHYGFLSSTWKRQKLKLLQEKLKVKVLEKAEKKVFMPKCPCCKTGNLHRILLFDQRGPPPWYLGGSQNKSSCKN